MTTRQFPRTVDEVGDVEDIASLAATAVHQLAERLTGAPPLWNRETNEVRDIALDSDERRVTYLTQLALAADLLERLTGTLDAIGRWALHYGATYAELGDAAGITRQGAHKRFRIPEEWRGSEFLPQPLD